MSKPTKVLRAFFGMVILLFVAVIAVSALSANNSIGALIGVFILVVLPFGNIGYSMVFNRPEEGSFSPITLYVYGALIAALGVFGVLMGELLTIWSLGLSAGCFQLARHKTRSAKIASE